MGELIVRATNESGYKVENTSRIHVWKSDEPLDHGGTDTGPEPVELLLSSLASCILITLRMYAQRKGIDLKETEVRLRVLEQTEAGTRVEKRLRLKGTLSEAERQRMLDISNRCPVARMLSRSIKFVIV